MKLPMSADAFAERFGPHPSRSTGTRLDSGAVPDRADQEALRRRRWACLVGSFTSQASPRRASAQMTQ